MADLLDIDHAFGGDLGVGVTGDLGTVGSVKRSQQRVLRRLLTALKTYIFHLDYGAGVPRFVGAVVDLAEVETVIRGQMFLESSVMRSPAPTIALQALTDGVSVDISYDVAPDRQPASLNFNVNA
ncbi:MAG TPA: hypothetical protein VJP88_03590 [Caulobacteraceae bacterium]|nr:hypothetical protein [Caulobacteraceae bacterium]